jgi:mRNA degradation ribonuclease J1/J2
MKSTPFKQAPAHTLPWPASHVKHQKAHRFNHSNPLFCCTGNQPQPKLILNKPLKGIKVQSDAKENC